jgi:hypothetical protein
MSYRDKVEACNRRDLSRLTPFVVDDVQMGWLTPERAAALLTIPAAFAPRAPGNPRAGVTLAAALGPRSAADRSKAIADIAEALPKTGLFQAPRRELYGIKNRWSDAEAFRLDRAFVPGFGARAYGVHVNGYVRKPDGLHAWIGTRALDCRVEPGKLDNMVAGGQPAGLGLMENLIKEAKEEAGLGEDIARRAVPAGMIAYAFAAPEGLKADTLFCYDLELPEGVRPRPSEEITGFDLLPLAEVLALIRDTDRFKFNVNLVILDFAMRHSVLTPDTELDFERIAGGSREWPQPVV